jgi:hypothetical protein
MTDESNEVIALIAHVLARVSAGPRASDMDVTDEAPRWLHEASAVVGALDDAGLLLRPGIGGTSEHPDLVQQVLDGSGVRKAHYAYAAALIDVRIERWKAQGAAEEQLRAFNERKANG